MVITDPGMERRPTWLDPFAARFINDLRDVPFLFLSFKLTVLLFPFALMFFLADPFPWWAAVPYWALLGYYAAPYNLMLHNTSHRQLFKKKYAFANHYVGTVLGAFFGHTPEGYFTHHVGMHHPENNLPEDLSSTMKHQRDSFTSFLRYYWNHISGVWYALPRYLHRKKRFALRNQVLAGMIAAYVLHAVLLYVNWRATLVTMTLPYFTIHFLMMAGNWGQHAFVDLRTPENCYRNSITCVNSLYNQRAFNDGYHIGHHLKATRHWTEMPAEFLANRETYAREGAIVFHTIDFFPVWLFLMLGRWNWLAKYYVELDGKGRTQEEIVALLKSRVGRNAAPVTHMDGLLRTLP